MPTLGIAFSGGGITALIASLCATNILHTIQHNTTTSSGTTVSDVLNDSNTFISTVSGGTVGYGVFVNSFSPTKSKQNGGGGGESMLDFGKGIYNVDVSYEDIISEKLSTSATSSGVEWYGRIIDYLKWIPDSHKLKEISSGFGSFDRKHDNDGVTQVKRNLRQTLPEKSVHALEFKPPSKNFWTNSLSLAFRTAYAIHPTHLLSGMLGSNSTWLTSFTLIDSGACPLVRDRDGIVKGGEGLFYATVDLKLHSLSIPSLLSTDGKSTSYKLMHYQQKIIDYISYSSAFWVAGIVENKWRYGALDGVIGTGVLNLNTASSSDVATQSTQTQKKVYLADGGIIDTTGITPLLALQTPRVLSFYNNNSPLSKESTPIAYLFGVDIDGGTDSMNSIAGSGMLQVFPSDLYPSVMANLTDGNIGRAWLRNVLVLANPYLGIQQPYILTELLILSNEHSAPFLSSFTSPEVQQNVSPRFPNMFDVSFGTGDCNLLCMFQGFKVQMFLEEILIVLGVAA